MIHEVNELVINKLLNAIKDYDDSYYINRNKKTLIFKGYVTKKFMFVILN